MKDFAALYQRLDRSTATRDRLAALVAYFRAAPPADAAWATWLLSGGKVGGATRRIATTAELRDWVAHESGNPGWLVQASHDTVGDLAETLSLLIDEPAVAPVDVPLSEWIGQRLLPVAGADVAVRRALVTGAWRTLPFAQRFVFNKLLTGALRVGVSQGLVQQALAEVSSLPVARVAQRLLGAWTPSAEFFARVLSDAAHEDDAQLPYPFFLASPLEQPPESLGQPSDWLIEWKWDGIRVQIIRREHVVLWSRGEERLDGRFPEIEQAAQALPAGTVIDGELLVWQHDRPVPSPFSALQTRIQRRRPGPKTLADAPVRVVAYDLLEEHGTDLRAQPLAQRRASLVALLDALPASPPRIMLSPALAVTGWDDVAALRARSRELDVEGLMLKRLDSVYRQGRRRGDWWKFKVAPMTIDAVLIYAQAGHGRRSTLYTDYTFAVWDGDALVPVAKAYSGLDDAEILRLDRWIRSHTRERFGPVRSVEPVQVFELGFEVVNASRRHRSGIAVRFPRILRWRTDKPAAEADRLDTLRALAR